MSYSYSAADTIVQADLFLKPSPAHSRPSFSSSSTFFPFLHRHPVNEDEQDYNDVFALSSISLVVEQRSAVRREPTGDEQKEEEEENGILYKGATMGNARDEVNLLGMKFGPNKTVS